MSPPQPSPASPNRPTAAATNTSQPAVVTADLLSLDLDPMTAQSPTSHVSMAGCSFGACPPSSRRTSSTGMVEASVASRRRGSRTASVPTSGTIATSMPTTTASTSRGGGGGGVESGAGFTASFASFADSHNTAMNIPLPMSPTTASSGAGPVALPPSPPPSSSGSGSMTPPNSSSRTNSSAASTSPPPSLPNPSSTIACARHRSSTPQLDPAPVTVTVPIPLAIPPKLVTAIQLSDEYIATYTKAADRAQIAGAALTVRVDHDDGDFVITSACPKSRKMMHQFLSQELAKVLAALPEQPLRRGSSGMGGFPGGSPRMRPLSIMSTHSSHSAMSSSGASGGGSSGSTSISGGHFLNQRHSTLAPAPSSSSLRHNVDPAALAARKRANRMSIISAWSIPDDSDDDTTPLTTVPLVSSSTGSALASKPAAKPTSRGFFSSTAPIPHSQWISSSPAAASANKVTNRNSWLAVCGASPSEQPQALTFADPPFANTAASSRPGFMAPPPSQPLPPAPVVPALAPPPSAVIAPNRPQGGYVHQVRGAGPRPTSMAGMGMFPPPPPPPSQSQMYPMSSR